MRYWRALAGLALFSLVPRLFRLSSPARLIFDEPAFVKVAEALKAGEDTLSYVHPLHPPLAPTVQAFCLRWARPSAPQRLPLPFIPRSVAYVPAQRTLYLLSPDGSTLAALNPMLPPDLRRTPLTRPLNRLASDASFFHLYGVSRRPLELMRIHPDGRCETVLPLQWMPSQVFVSHRAPEEAMLVDAPNGRIARWRLRPVERRWEWRQGERWAEVAYNAPADWLYVASSSPPALRVLDQRGDPLYHQPLDFAPSGIVAMAVFHESKPFPLDRDFDPVCLLDPFRQSLFCFQPPHPHAGESDWLHLAAPARAIGWSGQAGRLCLLSERVIWDVNPQTRRLVDRFACPEPLSALVLNEDGTRLIGVAEKTARLYLWRLPSVLLLGLMLPLLGMWLMRRAALGWEAVLTFMLLTSCDPLLWTLSRLAHPEPYIILAALAAYTSGYLCLRSAHERLALHWATISGLSIGAATATKWSGVTALGGLTVLTYLLSTGRLKLSDGEIPTPLTRRYLLRLGTCLCFGALVGYGACFALLWANGMSWEEWLWWHVKTVQYHLAQTEHPNAAPWWQWLLGGGTWRVFYDDRGTHTEAIYLCGAPWLWLPGLIGVGITAVRAWRTRELFSVLIVVAFAFAWLPWMLAPRTAFIYHFATALPFLYMAVAYVISQVRCGAWQISARWREVGLSCCEGYIILAVLTFIWLYPTLTGYPLPAHPSHPHNAWWTGWLPALMRQ